MDDEGYGPRMTLSVRDGSGAHHVVTESFQANVARADRRRWEKREQMAQMGLDGGARVSAAMLPEVGSKIDILPVPRAKQQLPGH